MSSGEIVIVTVVALIGIVLVVELVAMTALLVAVKNLVQEMHDRAEPLMTKADAILTVTRDVAETVGEHAGTVAGHATRASAATAGLVEAFATVLRQALLGPLIALLSALHGMVAGVDAARAAATKPAGDEGLQGPPQAASHE